MKEYIERQAAIDDICETANDFQDVLIPIYYMGLIKALPAADVVEVIRCRDCIYQKPDTIYGGIWCWAHREPFMLKTLDGFCSHGERREE